MSSIASPTPWAVTIAVIAGVLVAVTVTSLIANRRDAAVPGGEPDRERLRS
ncbi:hypothetical protein [Actinoplanes siamensis]|uniref:Uncharacterized protein n=1 Tax=Actinoplanes siamensis TaxID=1223317 RepID=A0A919TJB3_9ACTN|nr:hypothetical protein [Actinoplanes siamensis]GIF04300.1 hypothetical protein Asi03nite_18380 [Actinoplanes siamensis]